ncbi:MAG TPA: hypothetical protein VKU02_08480 [Gemmataceae bacterium]|nr:hypothetical protein [Gemmataceae bacterium]
MRNHVGIAILVAVLIAGSRGLRAQTPCCEPSQDGFLQRLGPVGGWHPYGGGLLRWWPRCCFRCGGGPDDYCRKPLPKVCWPPYPPSYVWGPQGAGAGPNGTAAVPVVRDSLPVHE